METLASALLAASALVLFSLATAHLWITFFGTKLHPRDPELKARMEVAPVVLTTRTTMWKLWIGFNTSHSLGGMLFGLIYGYLAIAQAPLLFHDPFLLTVGFLLLASFAATGLRYWFYIPNRGIILSTILYIAGVVVSRL